MITINFIRQKNFNFILILVSSLVISCSSQNSKISSERALLSCIDDYITVYNDSNIEDPLSSLVISSVSTNGEIVFFIDDAPEKYIFGEINKLKKKEDNFFIIGRYKGILCKFQSNNLNDYSDIFKKLSPEVYEKANASQIITEANGNSYIVDLSLINWEPNISITYNISQKNKIIKYFDENRTVNKEFKF